MDAKRTDEGYVAQLSRSVLKQKGRMFYISNNRSTDDLEDIFTYTFYEFSRFSQPELRFTRGSRAKQTRHVAWCLHEYRRNCMFLDQECHSAVNCPFYQERSNNRNRVNV